LYKYDGGTLIKEPVYSNEKVASNPSEYQVNPGDTLYSISKKFKLSIDELKSKNNMSDNVISIGQSLKIN
jgi:LysM repeat protein